MGGGNPLPPLHSISGKGGGLMKWMENGPKYPEEEEALHERELGRSLLAAYFSKKKGGDVCVWVAQQVTHSLGFCPHSPLPSRKTFWSSMHLLLPFVSVNIYLKKK